jgi:murein tripeptide amidase MpaA
VLGIEIATDPFNLRDGKPIFLNMGVHHAREWPSSEHSIEWVYDLLDNYGNEDRPTRLVRATRNIVIPVVNPDAFNISREAPAGPRRRTSPSSTTR